MVHAGRAATCHEVILGSRMLYLVGLPSPRVIALICTIEAGPPPGPGYSPRKEEGERVQGRQFPHIYHLSLPSISENLGMKPYLDVKEAEKCGL